MPYNKCNPSFQSRYAKIEGTNTEVSIEEIINGQVKRDQSFRCVPNGHELVVVNCTTRRPHFRHKNVADVEGTPMTQWHAEWQGNFPVTEQVFRRKGQQIRDRRADIVIPEYNKVVEIQHSLIESGEVNDRIHDYAIHNHSVIWVVHAQESITVKNLGSRLILEFTNNYWLYERFVSSCDTVYYDIEGLIYKVNPKQIRSHQVDVIQPLIKNDFIDCLKSNKDMWVVANDTQCYIYHRQQGAGSGKTYGIIQMLNSDPEISSYRHIIFITKQHSAVNVMYSEFKRQYDKGNLTNITLKADPIFSNKKYIVNYSNKLSGKDSTAIFATVDSLTHAIGDTSISAYDKFLSITKSIKEGYINTTRDGKFNYAGENPLMNKEMLIIIDETQDLTELYGEAFLKMVISKHTNLCVVGDSLQSLAFEKNALNFLQTAQEPFMKVIKSSRSNNVRRFTNVKLVNFVNSMVPFEKFCLPNMESATDIQLNTDENPLVIFETKKVNADEGSDSQNVIDVVESIMEHFSKEVLDNDRKPEDFLFVTPFSSINPVFEALQLALNIFWKDIMENNEKYILNVKQKDEYWSKVDTAKYNRYAVFHKSEEGTSIDLDESKKATRLVTIHSSKGDGRPVVFVYGVTQSALQKFSNVSDNLIYNSLLHVAITRQKEKLYFCLQANGDDIERRVRDSGNDILTVNNKFENIKYKNKLSDISKEIAKFSFDDIYDTIIGPQNITPLKKLDTDEKKIIDMGDHNIRYASMLINMIVHCCNNSLENNDLKQQYFAILNKIKSELIKPVSNQREYIKVLKQNSDTKQSNQKQKNKKEEQYIPILKFPVKRNDIDYGNYFNIIFNTMIRIINEIQSVGKKKLNYFCPLESVVLYYMIECVENGHYQKITINDLYNIVHIYSQSYSNTVAGHEYCACNQIFKNKKNVLDDIQKKYYDYLCSHYENLKVTMTILDRFAKEHSNIKWLYAQPVVFNGNNNEFKIYNSFNIIAYDDTGVYIFYIKPQLSELNFYECLVDSIYDTFLISNVMEDSENFKRFNGKSIYTNILSLTYDDLYSVNWTNMVSVHSEYMTKSIYDCMYKNYEIRHSQIYTSFINIMNSNTKKLQALEDIKKKLTDDDLPEYIKNTFNYIYTEVQRKKKKALDEYTTRDVFQTLINDKLKSSLKSYLKIHTEENDDEFV